MTMRRRAGHRGPWRNHELQQLLQMHRRAVRRNAPMMPTDRAILLHIQNLDLRELMLEPAEQEPAIVQVRWLHEFGQGRATSAPSDAIGARPQCCWFEPLSRMNSQKTA